MKNQGDMVGNTKGLTFIGIQNGAALPWGTPNCTGGIVMTAKSSLPSGKAFSESFGAKKQTIKGI